MKTVVADTSALISLAFSGQLETVCNAISVQIPEEVKQELEEMARFKDKKTAMANVCLNLVKKQKIVLCKVKNVQKAELLLNRNIDLGEATCVQLAMEQKIATILMDDLNASYSLASFATAKKIVIKISAAVIIELVNQQKITPREAKKSLLTMIQHRNWEKTTLEYLIQKYLE